MGTLKKKDEKKILGIKNNVMEMKNASNGSINILNMAKQRITVDFSLEIREVSRKWSKIYEVLKMRKH